MNLQINKEERDLIINLVANRAAELHPEIRHSMTYEFKEGLKHELECTQSLLERLKALDDKEK